MAKENPDGVVSFTAKGNQGYIKLSMMDDPTDVPDLSTIFGAKVYKITYKEIWETLQSQRIYLSPQLPLTFYKGLKEAMLKDEIDVLPGSDGRPVLLQNIREPEHPAMAAFIEQVEKDPTAYGFDSAESFNSLKELTLYQIGAMVVKTEDFRIFVDGNGKIREREPGQQDAIRLISACGVRGIYAKDTPPQANKQIVTDMFKTALVAGENGILIVPAVGMGVWGGDPDLYWRAFFDAVMSAGDDLDAICVNPGHQPTSGGDFDGRRGDEFQTILEEYRRTYGDHPNLMKIINLYESGKDIVQLAHGMKREFPDKTISLLNASDPDVTLGNHVGEYVNNLPHKVTTEENYTAMGTNGLCFEGITAVLRERGRVIQVGRQRMKA